MGKPKITVAIDKGNLVITIPAEVKNPPESSTGKTLLVASSAGSYETDLLVNGKPLHLNVLAYTYKLSKAEAAQKDEAQMKGTGAPA